MKYLLVSLVELTSSVIGVWLGTVNLLAAFKSAKKFDGKGGFIDVKEDFASGFVTMFLSHSPSRGILTEFLLDILYPSSAPSLHASQQLQESSTRCMR